MNHIIDKLSDIEYDATAIMDAAGERKKEIAQEMAAKTEAFDKQLEAETTARISDLRARMEIDMQTKLSEQKSDAEKVLAMMEASYHDHHEAYVKELFKAMIER